MVCRPGRPTIRLLPVLTLLFVACTAEAPRTLAIVLGDPHLEAAQLALEDELANGPIPGLDTMFILEGGNRAAPAIESAARVAEAPGVVAVIGHSNSAASLAAAAIYNAAGVTQVAPSSTAALYGEAGAYSFRMVPPDPLQGRFLAEALSRVLPDGGRVALFYVNDDYGRGLRAALVASLDTGRYELVIDLPHAEPGDLAETVEDARGAVRAHRPEAVFWLGRASTLNSHLPVFRAELGDVPVLGSDGVGTWRWSAVEVDHALWEGVQYVDFMDMESGSEALADFRRRYTERHDREASSPEALTYDAVRVVLHALREGARSGEEVRVFLTSLGHERPAYPGVSGPVSFSESRDITRPYHMTLIRSAG